MSAQYFDLSASDFLQTWSATSQIATDDDWSGVASIVGFRGDGLAATTGVNPTTIVGDDLPGVVDVNANKTDFNNFTTGGVTELELADPVVALKGSGTARAPYLAFYLNATGRQNITFSVDLRDVDTLASHNATSQVAVQYRVGGTGGWTNIDGGYVADASTAGAEKLTHLDLTLPSAVNGQGQLQIRVMTTDAVGSDEFIGVDNIVVHSDAGAPPDTTPPTLAAINPSDPDNGEVAVSPTSPVVLRFSESVKAGSGVITLASGTDVRTFDITDTAHVSITGATLTLSPGAPLIGDAAYEVTIGAGVVADLAGNAFAGIATGQLDFHTYDPAAIQRIYSLQGAGHASAYAGDPVLTTGVVTALDSNGFYLQDAIGDGDVRTSDGIFVFTGGAPTVLVGDAVNVGGVLQEFAGGANSLPVTEIAGTAANPLSVGLISHDNALPAAVVIGAGGLLPPTSVIENDGFTTFEPATDGADFYESLEGMRVTVQAPQVVGNTLNGATWVVASHGDGATGENARGGITISAGDYNPERIQLYADAGVNPGFTPDYATGDRLNDVTGVVSYFNGEYEVIPVGAVTVASHAALPKETTALVGDTAQATIASYNLENLDPTDGAVKFNSIATDIVSHLLSPDVIGVEEIQDNDGPGAGGDLSATLTLDTLVAAIAAAGGPQYAYATIAPTVANTTGGEPNGNIRNAFLYRTDRVSYNAGSAVLVNDPDLTNGDAFNNSRHPLAAGFTFLPTGVGFTAVDVHATARSGSEELFGADQPPLNAGEGSRNDQASSVAAFVNALHVADPSAHVAVMGDFNGFYFETALSSLASSASLYNLALSLAPEERYSYEFQGNAQLIDNLLVSNDLQAGSSFDVVHLNSEQPFAQQISSDHDAIVSRVYLDDSIRLTEGADSVGYADQTVGVLVRALGGNDTVGGSTFADTIYGGDGNDRLVGGGGDDRLSGDAGDDVLLPGVGTNTVDGAAGSDIVSYYDAPSAVNVDLSRQGTVQDTGVSHDLISNIENIEGSIYADQLTGDSGPNLLIGSLGADTLNGGAGADTFYYTQIYDSYLGSDLPGSTATATDYIVGFETGTDVIDVSLVQYNGLALDGGHVAITYDGQGDSFVAFGTNAQGGYQDLIAVQGIVAGSDVHVSAATSGLILYGSAAAETIAGSNGADAIAGNGGADTLYGGGGADRFVYGSVSDSPGAAGDLIADFQTGIDLIDVSAADAGAVGIAYDGAGHSFVGYAAAPGGYAGFVSVQGLVAASDVVVSSAVAGLTIYGSENADVLAGATGADVIYGAGGADVLIGSQGADTLDGGEGADVFRYLSLSDSPSGASDLIVGFQSGSDIIDLSAVDQGAAAISYADGYSYVAFGTPTSAGYPDVVAVQGLVLASDLRVGVGTSVQAPAGIADYEDAHGAQQPPAQGPLGHWQYHVNLF